MYRNLIYSNNVYESPSLSQEFWKNQSTVQYIGFRVDDNQELISKFTLRDPLDYSRNITYQRDVFSIDDLSLLQVDKTSKEAKSAIEAAIKHGMSTEPIKIGQNHLRPNEKISQYLDQAGEISTNPSNSNGKYASVRLDARKNLYLKGDSSYGGNDQDEYTLLL